MRATDGLSLAFGMLTLYRQEPLPGPGSLSFPTLAAKHTDVVIGGGKWTTRSALRGWFSIAQAGRKPCGDDLKWLASRDRLAGGEHGGLIDMAIFADDGVHRDVYTQGRTAEASCGAD